MLTSSKEGMPFPSEIRLLETMDPTYNFPRRLTSGKGKVGTLVPEGNLSLEKRFYMVLTVGQIIL